MPDSINAKTNSRTLKSVKAPAASMVRTEFDVSRYFPNTRTRVPAALLAWRRKFKQTGKNVFVNAVPTLQELLQKYGPEAQLSSAQMSLHPQRVKDPVLLAEWAAGKEKWDAQVEKLSLGVVKRKVQQNKARIKFAESGIKRLSTTLEAEKKALAKNEAALAKLKQKYAPAVTDKVI